VDGIRFDRLSRLFGAATTRRGAVAATIAAIAGSAVASAKKPRREGPCGDGGGKDNRCSRDKDCCTGICNTKNRRCRCRRFGAACTADENCCNSMSCISGLCGVGGGGGGCGTCPDGTHCVADSCVACTVCASGCPYPDLAAALDDAAGPSEILIAPGTYTGVHNATRPVTIDRCGSTGTVTLKTATPSSNVLTFQQAAAPSIVRNVTILGDPTVAGTTAVAATYPVLTLEDVIVDGTAAGVNGVGNSGSLTLNRCTVKNTTTDSGVKLSFSLSTGTLTITDSTITDNTCTNTNQGGGGIALIGSVTATLTGTTVQNNTADGGNGGGIVLLALSSDVPTLNIGTGTTISDNSATGAVASFLGYGGGIAIKKGTVTGATASNVYDNSATQSCNNMYDFDTTTCLLV
jgi:hypothetical protein